MYDKHIYNNNDNNSIHKHNNSYAVYKRSLKTVVSR